jgi:type II secretory pathway predicted ATPase ExeA
MYEAHFGLRRRPFRPTPDCECYYPATTHERALAQLVQAVTDDEGIALLTGNPGSGKTVLCHRLLECLGEETTTAFLTNSHVASRAGLLQALLYDLSLPYEGRGEQEMRLALTDYLLQNYATGRRAVLVIDEAQHLSPDLLEELRLLGNLEAGHGKAVQLVLVAQPWFVESLQQPELASFSQRLVVRSRLEALDVQEAADYLVHHLRTAGGRPEEIITDEALAILARGTHGVPRLLNQAAHQALAIACTANTAPVDAEVALEALAALGLEAEEAPSESRTLVRGPEQIDRVADEEAGSDEAVIVLREEPVSTGPDGMIGADRPHRLYASGGRSA